jgi:hypothetical protein
MQQENYPAFVYRHCGPDAKPLLMPDNGSIFVCADGATIMASNAEDRREPPDDPSERQQFIIAYRKAAVQEAEDEFTTVRHNLVSQQTMAARFANLPGVDPEALLYLNDLKAKVEKLRRELAEAEAAFIETPAAAAMRQRLADENRRAIDRARLVTKFGAVTI